MLRLCFALAFAISLLTPTSSQADNDTEQALYQLMIERLTLMPEVAKYKLYHDLPIEDLAREATVLKRTVTRMQTLDPTHTTLFFSLQMNAAKAIQTSVIKSLSKQTLVPAEVRSLNDDLRPMLTMLGDQIIEQLLIAFHQEISLNRSHFDTHFEDFNLSPQIKDGLFKSLELVLTKPPKPKHGTLARIQSDRVLRVGVTLDYAPFSYQNASGELLGVDIELVKALAADLGYEIVWVKTSWPTLMTDAKNDAFDIALSGISITAARQADMLFSAPYHTGGKTAIGHCESKPHLANLAMIDSSGVRVIVNPGGTNERFVRGNISKASVHVHPDNRTIFREIVNNNADVMFTDSIEAQLQATKHPSLCVLLDPPLTFQQKGVLLQPDPELKALIDTWLLDYMSSQDLKSLFSKHGVASN
jgi:cyclohexadienyl dehydratase